MEKQSKLPRNVLGLENGAQEAPKGLVESIRNQVEKNNAELPVSKIYSNAEVDEIYEKKPFIAKKLTDVLGKENVELYLSYVRDVEVFNIDKLFLTEESFSEQTLFLYASELDEIKNIANGLLDLANIMVENLFQHFPIDLLFLEFDKSKNLDALKFKLGFLFKIIIDLFNSTKLEFPISLNFALQEIFSRHAINLITQKILLRTEALKKRGGRKRAYLKKYSEEERNEIKDFLSSAIKHLLYADQYITYYNLIPETEKTLSCFLESKFSDEQKTENLEESKTSSIKISTASDNEKLFSEIKNEMTYKSTSLSLDFVDETSTKGFAIIFSADRPETNRLAFLDRLHFSFSFSIIPVDAVKIMNANFDFSFADKLINKFSISHDGEMTFGETNIPAKEYFASELIEKVKNRVFKMYLARLSRQKNILEDYYEFDLKNEGIQDIEEISKDVNLEIEEKLTPLEECAEPSKFEKVKEKSKTSSYYNKIKGLKVKKVKSILKKILGAPIRINGSHHIYEKDGQKCPVAFHGNKEVSFPSLLSFLKQFGILERFCGEI